MGGTGKKEKRGNCIWDVVYDRRINQKNEVFTSEVLKALSKCNPYNSHNSVTTALQHDTEARAESDDGARNHHVKSAI